MSPLKILVCGGRQFPYWRRDAIFLALDRITIDPFELTPRPGTAIAHGKAKGVDTWADVWAVSNGVPVSEYPADWGRYGRAAGHIRNAYMLGDFKPDLVVAFPGGKGTMGMINLAGQAGVGVVMYDHDGNMLHTVEPKDAALPSL